MKKNVNMFRIKTEKIKNIEYLLNIKLFVG